jgi:hypothetical protein
VLVERRVQVLVHVVVQVCPVPPHIVRGHAATRAAAACAHRRAAGRIAVAKCVNRLDGARRRGIVPGGTKSIDRIACAQRVCHVAGHRVVRYSDRHAVLALTTAKVVVLFRE